jgi:hypothetical protein
MITIIILIQITLFGMLLYHEAKLEKLIEKLKDKGII